LLPFTLALGRLPVLTAGVFLAVRDGWPNSDRAISGESA
jgi:hypothetical protein